MGPNQLLAYRESWSSEGLDEQTGTKADVHGKQTDTHGWLEGHLRETNYGADWGDVVSFTAHMRAKAKELGVDLLVVDTGITGLAPVTGTNDC